MLCRASPTLHWSCLLPDTTAGELAKPLRGKLTPTPGKDGPIPLAYHVGAWVRERCSPPLTHYHL